ncbi:MAG: Dyp-type peroxidase [Vulcanimicrobiaceae bacterium]
MATPQTGIFALGDAAHAFLEFTRIGGSEEELIRAVVAIHEPHTTVGGVNLVVGFRPELWRAVAPDDAPLELSSFSEPLVGTDGYAMPATQADLWMGIAGASYGVVFDVAKRAVNALAPLARLERELEGWSYRRSRDLTGFEDGTENPSLLIAPSIATVADGKPGAGGSVLLFQQWRHDATAWEKLTQAQQEQIIGRTKPDSIEFPDDKMPRDSHVERTTVTENGMERDIFRRNVPYGNVSDHGTIFIGFSADRERLQKMLEQMAGVGDGIRDALTRFTTPLTGAYYFVPSLQAMQRLATPEDHD